MRNTGATSREASEMGRWMKIAKFPWDIFWGVIISRFVGNI
jgi:hypothetical protein